MIETIIKRLIPWVLFFVYVLIAVIVAAQFF
jgi:hypothetical protein